MATGRQVDRYVLDSFAVMALLQSEQSAPRVAEILDAAQNGKAAIWMSVVDLGEVAYRYQRDHGLAASSEALWHVSTFPLDLVDADLDLTLAAAALKAEHPIAYADAFAAALAQHLDATLVTGDPEFKHLEDVIEIEWL